MLPAKIKGLNQDTSDESNDEEEEIPITKEAHEQKTQQLYREALILQKQSKFDEAKELLQELLQSEILQQADGKVKYVNGRLQPSLLHLKYCCYLNLGNILCKSTDYQKALDNYIKATELDDTDLNLWYRIGNVAMKIPNLTFAISAFMETLNRNPQHWPSLDSIITATYAVGDLMACLLYISNSLNLDSSYVKGIILKERIFSEHYAIKQDFQRFYPNCTLRSDAVIFDPETSDSILRQIETLKSKDAALNKNSRDAESEPLIRGNKLKPLKNSTWLCLGKFLLKLYKVLNESDTNESFFSLINIKRIHDDDEEVSSKKQNSTTSTMACNESVPMEMEVSNETYTNRNNEKSASEFSENEDELTEFTSISSKQNEPEKDTNDAVLNNCKSKKRKCSPTLADQLKNCDKRRSTRNKTVLKSNEASLSKILKNFISGDLLPQKDKISKNDCYDLMRWNDDSFDTMDIYRLLFEHQEENDVYLPVNDLSEETRNKLLKDENYFGTDKEKTDIEWYVQINSDQMILELLEAYIKDLSSKWSYTWPSNLTDFFVEMYQILLKHGFEDKSIKLLEKSVSKVNLDEEYLKMLEEKTKVILLFGELLLNQHLEDPSREQPLGNSILGENFSSLLIGDLHDACSILNSSGKNMKLWMRAYWLEALLFLQKKDFFASCCALSVLIEEIPDSNVEVRLSNLKQFHIISLTGARRLLNTLNRNQNLSEVKPLFLENQFDRVVEILEDTLKPGCEQLMHLPNENSISRYEQYNLLLAALWESKNYQGMFRWCEVGCYEGFAVYRKSFFDEIDTDMKSKWASLVMNTLNGMLSCLKIVGLSLVDTLKSENLSRLVQTLCNLVCHQIEANEPSPEIIVDVVTPWILLANLVDFNNKKQMTESIDNDNVEVFITPSLSLLLVAHEHLGRRTWCCFNDGALLFYTLNVIEPLYKKCVMSSETWITLIQQIDQIFYCLYSHPFKKNKARHVQDHGTLGLALTWARAVQAYSFYRPITLPMFDAVPKYCTISGDTETLLKRMTSLVPEEQNPSNFVDSVVQYLNGSLNEIPANENKLQSDVIDLYYLLGDYYFKNKIMGKAVKYYLLDICSNPYRIDSWSAMALARGSLLEMRLNSCETITNESEILKKAELTDKCYKTALQLDFNQSSLWIEYGVFCYAVHGFCSRLQKQDTNLSLQMFEMLENQKNRFLSTSYDSFNSANEAWLESTAKEEDVHDERWLHHYMLGKIAEKREEKADVYLHHYYEASQFLHQNGAEYPMRILYSSPQYYSVEALEMYYRIHVSILKMLKSHEEKPLDHETIGTFTKFIHKMAEGPFASAKAKLSKNFENGSKTGDKLKDVANKENDTKNSLSHIVSQEVRDILEEMIVKVITHIRSTPASKRKMEEATYSQEEPRVKKLKMENDEIKFNNETKLSNDYPRNFKKKKLSTIQQSVELEDKKNNGEVQETDSSSACSPPSETSPDSSPDESSSVISESGEETERETKKEMSMDSAEVKNPRCWQKTRKMLLDECVKALEECIRRFPEHYKSYYRLSQHYFCSKLDKDIEKARKLLIDKGGLFQDRTTKNFFGGIWRIPTGEIDRPGSFAFHMSRSIHLLMDILRDMRDYKMLLHLSNQLRLKPDPDKKYLRDNEREQLCKEALSLSVQSLRKHIDHISPNEKEENKRKLLLDVYKCYNRISKRYSQKDAPFGKLLNIMFQKYTNREDKVSYDQILSFCKSVNMAAKNGQPFVSTLPEMSESSKTQSQIHTQMPVVAPRLTQILNFSLNDAKLQILSRPQLPPKQKSNNVGYVAPIPNNLKNLPPAITVTTVPPAAKSTPSHLNVWDKNTSRSQSTTSKSRNTIIIRQNVSKEKTKLKPEQAKHKTTAHSSGVGVYATTSYAKPTLKEKSSKSKNPLMVEGKTTTSASVSGGDGGLTIIPVLKDTQITGMSVAPSHSKVTISATKHSSVQNVPKYVAAVGKDRPSLIITPVTAAAAAAATASSVKTRPTLQQKLAAKQMANSSITKSSTTFTAETCPNATISQPKPQISQPKQQGCARTENLLDMSRNLGSSGVSIFALPVDRYAARESQSPLLSSSEHQYASQYPIFLSKLPGTIKHSSSMAVLHSTTNSKCKSSKSDVIDFNNLKTCNKGLIIEQASPKSKSLHGLEATSKSGKKSQIEVITLK